MKWSSGGLWLKAKAYMARALDCERDDAMFAFWTSLALEFLARAAVSNVHPVLLADNDRERNSVLYALGRHAGTKAPRSADSAVVFSLCRRVIGGFGEEDVRVCLALSERRNEELHTEDLPFERYPTNVWLAGFYRTAKKLADSCGHSLQELLGAEEAVAAEVMLEAADAAVEDEVRTTVRAHRTIFERRDAAEQEALRSVERKREPRWARTKSRDVKCPACGSNAIVTGDLIVGQEARLSGDVLQIREAMLPTTFSCDACGLKLLGHARLHAAGVGGQFTRTIEHDPADFFEREPDGPDYDPDEDW